MRLSIKEELALYGGSNVEVGELVSILLGMNTDKATELLERYGSLQALLVDTTSVTDITVTQKAKLGALKALYNKHIVPKEYATKISSPDIVFNKYRRHYEVLEEEHFDIIILNTKNKVVDRINISKGILNASLVHPREVFKQAIRRNANSIILVHNHPSGDSKPSKEDIEITERMCDSGELLGVKVLDHIIFGVDEYTSFRERSVSPW